MYSIMRLEKYGRSAVSGIGKERTREKDDSREFAASDIDKNRTEFNVILKDPNGKELTTENWNRKITAMIKSHGCKERKDSIVMVGGLFTASPDYFTLNKDYVELKSGEVDERQPEQKQKWLQDEKTMDYFQDCLEVYVETMCGGDWDKIIDARIDFDEATPHLQIYSTPIIGDDEIGYKLCAKDLFGNRGDMRARQDYFHEKVGAPRDMERGEKVNWDLPAKEQRKHKEKVKWQQEQEKHLDAVIEGKQEYIDVLTDDVQQIEEAKQRGIDKLKDMKAEIDDLSQIEASKQEKIAELEKRQNKAEIKAEQAERKASYWSNEADKAIERKNKISEDNRTLKTEQKELMQDCNDLREIKKGYEVDLQMLRDVRSESKKAVEEVSKAIKGEAEPVYTKTRKGYLLEEQEKQKVDNVKRGGAIHDALHLHSYAFNEGATKMIGIANTALVDKVKLIKENRELKAAQRLQDAREDILCEMLKEQGLDGFNIECRLRDELVARGLIEAPKLADRIEEAHQYAKEYNQDRTRSEHSIVQDYDGHER